MSENAWWGLFYSLIIALLIFCSFILWEDADMAYRDPLSSPTPEYIRQIEKEAIKANKDERNRDLHRDEVLKDELRKMGDSLLD